MVYKYSDEYDNILDLEADLDFIKQFFTINKNDLEKAKIQLLTIYNLENKYNLQKSVTSIEKALTNSLNKRNIALIEKQFLELKMQEFNLNAIPYEDGSVILSIEEALEYAKIDCRIAELSVNIEKYIIELLTISLRVPKGIIWNKKRNILVYRRLLKEKTTPEATQLDNLMSELNGAQLKLKNVFNAPRLSSN